MGKTYTAEPISFIKRFLRRVIEAFGFAFFILIFVLLYINNIQLRALLIIVIISFLICYGYTLSSIHYTKIEILNEKIHFIGYKGSSEISFEEEINNVMIYPKVRASRAGHIGYYLIFESKKRKYIINNYFNWDDEYVIALFNDFKISKGEKITLDEKYTLKLTKY